MLFSIDTLLLLQMAILEYPAAGADADGRNSRICDGQILKDQSQVYLLLTV